jgi:pantetheine-phosphate adenylyltransferase
MDNYMNKIAVFPGTFDPFTLGHQHIAERALFLCDKLIIAIGNNHLKKQMFDVNERKKCITTFFIHEKRIETAVYNGLTIDFCRQVGAKIIVRGIRSLADCHQEILIAHANQQIDHSIETIFLLAMPSDTAISSTAVREVLANNGNAEPFLPKSNFIDK